MPDKIVVLDFGSQYNQLIARRIREFGVYSELHSNEMTLEEIKKLEDVKGIVFSGGPEDVFEADAPKCDPATSCSEPIFLKAIPSKRQLDCLAYPSLHIIKLHFGFLTVFAQFPPNVELLHFVPALPDILF